jgi:SAM-dependent methyltransferase
MPEASEQANTGNSEANTEHSEQYKTLEVRFDRIAKMYDAAYGPPDDSGHGNALISWLRAQHLEMLCGFFPAESLLLDIGCGTGEDALALAHCGYSVLGIDISPAMVRQAQTKAAVHGIRREASFRVLPAGQVGSLDERGPFGGAYSSLGTLNTEPDLPGLAKGLHALLEPGAAFVATVMSRHCAYEILRNLAHFQPSKTLKRGPDWQDTRAGAGGITAPVKFYTPKAFAAPFKPYFAVERVLAFPLWMPPVHLHELYHASPKREAWDRQMRSWPGFRAWGDHFLMVLRRTAQPDQPTN